jgi:hypothetical protein
MPSNSTPAVLCRILTVESQSLISILALLATLIGLLGHGFANRLGELWDVCHDSAEPRYFHCPPIKAVCTFVAQGLAFQELLVVQSDACGQDLLHRNDMLALRRLLIPIFQTGRPGTGSTQGLA